MFKLAQTDTFWWPVKVSLPTDGGKYEQHSFSVRFGRMSQERLMRAYADIARAPDLIEHCARERALAREVVKEWRDVHGPDGQPLDFNEANLDMVLDVALVQAAILNSYGDALKNASRKN